MSGRCFLPLLLVVVFAGGCADLDRQRECRLLADAVNPLLADIERLAERSQPPSPKSYAALAESYRKLKNTARKLAIKDERLDEAVDAYLDMVTLAEKQLKQSASALGTNKEQLEDAELLRRHQLAMSPVLAQQVTTQGRLRGLCKP